MKRNRENPARQHDAAHADDVTVGTRPSRLTMDSDGSSQSYGTFPSAQTEARGKASAEEEVPLLAAPESTFEKYTSCRWTLAYLLGWVNLMMFCLRNCISMALVCISGLDQRLNDVTPTANVTILTTIENVTYQSGGNSQNSSFVVPGGPGYIPDNMEGVVLSAYFYGYIFTPFAGGLIAAKLGVKRVLAVSMAMSAAFTLVMPWAVRSNIYLTVAMRVLLGFVAGVTQPACTMMWTHWAPQHEKGKLLSITLSGSSTGSIVANLVSGFLCSIPLDEGWPFIFYIYGSVAALWVVLWLVLAYDSPEHHPRVSEKERAVIGWTQKTAVRASARLPLRAVFTSVPFYAMIMAHMADSWFINYISSYLPLYFSAVLKFDTQASGVLSSLPFISRVVFNIVFAIASDKIHMHRLLSVTNNRKLFQTIGLVIPSAMLVGLGYMDPSQRYAAVVMFVVLSGIESASQLGFRLTPLDIAPRFAGPLSGLSVTFGTAVQIVCPLVTSAIAADDRPESWAKTFIISGVIGFVGAAMFLIGGSGVEQEWAHEKKPLFVYHNQYGATSNVDWQSTRVAEDELTESQRSFRYYRDNYPEILTSGEH